MIRIDDVMLTVQLIYGEHF